MSKKKDSCARRLTDAEKIQEWEEIYTKSLSVIKANLGISNESQAIYAACTAITNASREIQYIKKIMEATGKATNINSWYGGLDFEIPKYDSTLNN